MTAGIYCFTNKINQKKYIGQSLNIEKRYKEHKTRYTKPSSSMYSSIFYQALRKYGFDCFDFSVIDQCDNYTREDLNILEQYYIKEYNTYYNGYNMNYGGDSVYVSHKLSLKEVEKIKKLLKETNKTFIEIAQQFNITSSLISSINKGIFWKDIGLYDYPIREDTYKKNKGEINPNAILTNEEVLIMRKRYVYEDLNSIYQDYKNKVSYSTVKKVLYGSQFKSLPIYKKRQKAWFLNGTCIDYPRVEE